MVFEYGLNAVALVLMNPDYIRYELAAQPVREQKGTKAGAVAAVSDRLNCNTKRKYEVIASCEALRDVTITSQDFAPFSLTVLTCVLDGSSLTLYSSPSLPCAASADGHRNTYPQGRPSSFPSPYDTTDRAWTTVKEEVLFILLSMCP